jgi:hypothetical protein
MPRPAVTDPLLAARQLTLADGPLRCIHFRMFNRLQLLGAGAVAGLQALAGLMAVHAAQASALGAEARELSNAAYQLVVSSEQGQVLVRFEDKLLNLNLASGPYFYSAQKSNGQKLENFRGLQDVDITGSASTLVIRGKLAGLDLEHHFALSSQGAFLEEAIVLRNNTEGLIALSDFEAGFVRAVTDKGGEVLPELAGDRWVAVPLRARASDPKGFVNDFSMQQLVTQPGYEPRMDFQQHYFQAPSPHHVSEGWAWSHGRGTLGIFAFNQENMLFSVVSSLKEGAATSLRFGGACLISGEPAALTRIAPGQTVDLGVIRYESVKGGYPEATYAFRDWLDEKGCRFPKDYDPPVHWEQLYDMEGAWDDRLHRYTKSALEKEALKAVDYHCQALYLDPGWDTTFGSFLWGEQWLGPRRQFIQEMNSKYGLKVSLHCPLATWISTSYPMGPSAMQDWPAGGRRTPAPVEPSLERKLLVPALREGRRNLALLPAAQARASSVLSGGSMPIHQIAHLNDGWYGNRASWIADQLPAWAEIDLGSIRKISTVVLGNDHAGEFADRAATSLRILAATDYAADSSAASWRAVVHYEGEGILQEKSFPFEPVSARWVRVELLKSLNGLPRLDEIEIYEAEPVAQEQGEAFARQAKRGPEPPAATVGGPLLCLGSKAYLDEAAKRLLANCADGAAFLMFDGNWWNGGCVNTNHGHPVPYRMEDHIRANIELVQRVHAQYPKVLIELHDCVAGGSPVRYTPVYYKYGLPGSYDENWGFELMWDPMADLKGGAARALYYYNLGCNVPIYLHIDLRKDNLQAVVFWWYASTCRHLGIGGTCPNPAVVEAQKGAMKRYRELDRFYKRGEFFGLNEEVHLHVLPEEKAFVVNLFNLSDQPRTISGSIALDKIGLNSTHHYEGSSAWGRVEGGELKVSLPMEPWSAQVADFREKRD